MIKFTFLIFLILNSSFLLASQKTERSEGTAKNSKGEIVYIEKHTSQFSNGNLNLLNTNYFTPDGKKFGFLKSDFSLNSFVPNYRFEDLRHNKAAGVQSIDKNTNREILAFSEDTTKKVREEKIFNIKNNSVTGQGLHNFLLHNLPKLKNNLKLKIDIEFIIPRNQDKYAFRIRVKNYDQTKEVIKLRIEADNWLFRIIAPHIDVTYDTNNKRLLRYEGPSNLLNKKGKKMKVEINYVYPKHETIKNLIDFYTEFDLEKRNTFDKVYSDKIDFRDPFHKINGNENLYKYFKKLTANVLSCEFKIIDVVEHNINEKQNKILSAVVFWKMHYSHKKLSGGNKIIVDGCSHIKFNEKVIFHQDYFDSSQMLYRHIPVFGWIIRLIEGQI